MPNTYRIRDGSIQDKFFKSKKKIQIYAGGFGNGKTSAVCVRTLEIAKDYPGANILMARETYPKLNDTLRKEMMKWCPKAWIKKEPTEANNNLVLQNGSVINFRYIAQQGKNAEQSTSNLLSANYDLIVVDQIEDPKITHKDFLDLLGRLRGSTPYRGDDGGMPRSGPRMMFLTANPSRNWVYRKLIRPLELFNQAKIRHDDLYVDDAGNPIIDLFEGSTLDNADNLPSDFISTLKSTYKGQQYQRFVLGKWDAYEGLIYPDFSPITHVIPDAEMRELHKAISRFAEPTWIAGYDHGISSPACYVQAFCDIKGNVHICDGFYEAEKRVETFLAPEIIKIQSRWNVQNRLVPFADPQIFKRAGQVGAHVGDIFSSCGVQMSRGNNNIDAGIEKLSSYMQIQLLRKHPYTGNIGSPMLFVSDRLTWFVDEISEYAWKRDTSGAYDDTPKDVRDHAMDATKYMFTSRPKVASIRARTHNEQSILTWRELDIRPNDIRISSRRV